LATNVDLYRNISWFNAPVDDPLLAEADRFRAVERRIHDSLWLRILDVAAALESRSYERDGTLVLGIHDRFDPSLTTDAGGGSAAKPGAGPAAGRYRLEVVDGAARCSATDATAQVELTVEVLGRLLLGGTTATELRRAGLIDGSPEAMTTLHDLFATRTRPHCSEIF
jgi:predicted acetyltransferase